MPAAKRATLGQDNPVKRFLDGVSDAYTSKIDRSAIRTVRGCHNLQYHHYSPVFASSSGAAVGLGLDDRGKAGPRLKSGRLFSLAASICSGVLTSGSESLTRSLARATCRLCRFANLLSIPLQYTCGAGIFACRRLSGGALCGTCQSKTYMWGRSPTCPSRSHNTSKHLISLKTLSRPQRKPPNSLTSMLF